MRTEHTGAAGGGRGGDPDDTAALLRFGELAVKAGHDVVACETYSRAGDEFARQGLPRRAITSFELALNIARVGGLTERVSPIARMLGQLSLREKLVRDAVTTLDSAAGWLMERGLDANALPLLEDRLEIDDSEIARVRLAEAYFRLREADKGIAHLSAAFYSLQVQGRTDEALEVAERLLRERRDVGVARAAAELYLSRNGKGDAYLALAQLRVCCDVDPASVPTLELLARAFDLAGHGEKAARVRREVALLGHGGHPRPPVSVRPSIAPSSAGPRHSAIRPKAMPRLEAERAATDDSIECDWDELVSEGEALDPARPSFWPQAPAPGEASERFVSVSLTDIDVDGVTPSGRSRSERAASIVESALECIESLCAQGRYEEAALLVVRQLTIRPHNPLLLERKAEIEAYLDAHAPQPSGDAEPPPSIFFGLSGGGESDRNVVAARSAASALRSVKAS